jgi:hypothetical protein
MRWLARQKEFRFNYISDFDMDDPTILSGSRLLIVIGHSEYWTRKARENFDAFVERGGNVLILSGNTMWWQVRYSKDGSQLICYKLEEDPIKNPLLKTTNWTNSILKYPIVNSIGEDFTLGGFGRKSQESFGGIKITSTEPSIFRGTGIKEKDVLAIPTKEYDGTFLKMENGKISLEKNKLPFYKVRLLGYDHTINDVGQGYGSFIIFKKTRTSGTTINAGTADWCSYYGIGGADSTRIQKLTLNMIRELYHNRVLF